MADPHRPPPGSTVTHVPLQYGNIDALPLNATGKVMKDQLR